MKRKIRTCDVCGRDITNHRRRYKFKMYETGYVNMEDFEFAKYFPRDMCESCFDALLIFARKRKNDPK